MAKISSINKQDIWTVYDATTGKPLFTFDNHWFDEYIEVKNKEVKNNMTDDIAFCYAGFEGEGCDNTKCMRHPSNIIDKNAPHSFGMLKNTEYCMDYDLTNPSDIHEVELRRIANFFGMKFEDFEKRVEMIGVKSKNVDGDYRNPKFILYDVADHFKYE